MKKPPQEANPIAVDFETVYTKGRLDIKTLGMFGYVWHPEFDAYLVSVYGDGIEFVGAVTDFDWSLLNDQIFIAHNVAFDQLVFERCQQQGHIPKSCKPKEFHCTADLSVYISAPRTLKGASKELLDLEISKATRSKMEGLTLEEARARGFEDELYAYALQDAKLCYELWTKFSDRWPEHEREIARINREAGNRGIYVDQEYLAEGIRKLQKIQWDAERLFPWEWDQERYKTPIPLSYIREQCREDEIKMPSSMAQDSEACAEWEAEYGDRLPWILAVRRWRKSNTHLARLKTIQKRIRGDGTVPYNLKYFGAHTGRFSGDGGLNLQNLIRNAFMGVNSRNCFIARPGKILLILDYAQIEARILLHLAGDVRSLELIRSGVSVYEAHARRTMNWTGGSLKIEDPSLYSLAKARVLGLGFGCGAKTFIQMAKTWCDIELSEKESQEIVYDYRENNMQICGHWKGHQTALHQSLNAKDSWHGVELLSGRTLIYYNPMSDLKEKGSGIKVQKIRGGHHEKFWGGKFTENEVQATARDLFCDGMLKIAAAGYPPLFHVHDEFIFEVDIDKKEAQRDEIHHILSNVPDWMGDCPISFESDFSERYTK